MRCAMKLGYNVATTKENATLQQELELCDKHGYDFIEIQMDKMPEYLETHTLEDMKAFFDTHDIKPLSLNALQFFNNRNDADYRAVLDEFKEWLEIAHYLGQNISFSCHWLQKLKYSIRRFMIVVLRL